MRFGILAATIHLLQKLELPTSRIVTTALLQMIVGVLEASTVGLLVPLLALLTGSDSKASSALLSGLYRVTGPIERTTALVVLAGLILGVIATKNVLLYVAARYAAALRAHTLAQLRNRLLHRVLHAPAEVLERHTTGEIGGALLSEATRVNRALEYCVVLMQRTCIALAYVGAILLLSWQLTLLTIGLGAGLGLISRRLGRRGLRAGRETAGAEARLARQITETLGGLNVIRTTASQSREEATFAAVNQSHADADARSALSPIMTVGLTETLGIAGAMLLTALAFHFWLVPGRLEVSQFLAFGFGLLRLVPAVNQIWGLLGLVGTLTGAVERSLFWLDLPRYPVTPFGERAFTPLRNGISVENLSFSYSDGHQALRSLSLEIHAGETALIVGASGAGKSTLVSLLLRKREPQGGSIRFDGVNYWEFSSAEYHRAVAVVEQEPFLFNASILDNVVYGAPWVTREEALAALNKVALSDLLARLPDGIDTVLVERGASLSGGQRQRLVIARAIVRNPQVLILDEPTSALDAETEQEVIAAIEQARVGRTTIIITHRPNAIPYATKRFVLEAQPARVPDPIGAEPQLQT